MNKVKKIYLYVDNKFFLSNNIIKNIKIKFI